MHRPRRTTYFLVFAALLVLLGATVGVSFLSLGVWGPVAAMTVAVAKTVLILLFFMHLYDAVPLVRVIAVAGVVWLLLLLTFVAGDYLTRQDVVPASRQASRSRPIAVGRRHPNRDEQRAKAGGLTEAWFRYPEVPQHGSRTKSDTGKRSNA